MVIKQPFFRPNNAALKAVSGIEGLRFYETDDYECDEAGELLAKLIAVDHLVQYIDTGDYVSEYLAARGMQRDDLSSRWWKQFEYIKKNAVINHSRSSMYFVESSRYIADPGDDELIKVGSTDAHTRLGLGIYCSWLISAMHPEANHAFYRAIIEDAQEYIPHRTYPKFPEQPELTPEELKDIKEAAMELRRIYERNPSAHPYNIVHFYISKKYTTDPGANVENDPVGDADSFSPPYRFAQLGNRLLDISDRQYQFALSVRPDSDASVLPVPDDIMARLKFDEKTGQLSLSDESNDALSTLSGRLEKWTPQEKVTESDFMFLRTALTALYKNPEFIDEDKITIKRTELGKHMGSDLSAGNAVDVIGSFKSLEKLIGRTPDGSIYRVFTFLKYDSSSDSYSFACPFINQVILNLEEKNRVEYRSKAKELKAYTSPHINYLLHSSLHKERNRRAVEIVMALTNLLLQRAGETTRKPKGRDCFDVHIRYSTLISYCPLLSASLDYSEDKANRNRILKTSFSKAYELLREKTDAFSYFENLKIPEMKVTNSTLDEVIKISFTGIHHLG